jgi:hypothetical protein
LGLLGGEQIERTVVTASCEVACDETVDRAGDLLEQLADIIVPRRGSGWNGTEPSELAASGDTVLGWVFRTMAPRLVMHCSSPATTRRPATPMTLASH